jgi:undecaprenyl-phosphate 4-deoxy-4-formamido-L-arabinose transferase
VEHYERKVGKSGYTIKKLIALWLSMFTNFSILPLRIAVGIGFVFAGIAFLIGITSVIEKIFRPGVPVGYTFLVFIITLLAGIQLIVVGLVGEYLGRMLLNQNKKPQYSIRMSLEKADKKDKDVDE